jgi:hypothetical protein
MEVAGSTDGIAHFKGTLFILHTLDHESGGICEDRVRGCKSREAENEKDCILLPQGPALEREVLADRQAHPIPGQTHQWGFLYLDMGSRGLLFFDCVWIHCWETGFKKALEIVD